MGGGYAGKVLFVDLTHGRFAEEILGEGMLRAFIGGQGLGVRIIFERMKPRIDPLGSESILGFVTGVLTATPVAGSGRYMVVGKSPLTGTWAESSSGGSFGPMLKEAGYDGIFFTGVAPKPVYLLVRNGQPELRDAVRVWGKDTHETDDLLHHDIGDDGVKIACIGPSGEACSLLAGIVNEKGRIAARSGLGAVMGAKRLKAVAVKGGFRKIKVADRIGLKKARDLYQTFMNASDFQKGLTAGGTAGGTSFLVSIGDSPIKNWRMTGLDAMPSVTNLDSQKLEKYKIATYGCYACPIRCGALIEQKQGPYTIKGEMHRPEYESTAALGSLLFNDNGESIIKAIDICNRYGIDTINTGGTIALAMECFENGLLTKNDTDGLDLTWGNADTIVTLTERIARREGFGAVLADGAAKAAERIGRGAAEYAIAIRGQSLPFHDPRMGPALATSMMCDANPAHHMECGVTAQLDGGLQIGTHPALQMPTLNPMGDFDKKGPMYALGAKFHQLFNAAGMCALFTIGSSVPIAELISGVTGWDFDWPEALDAGARILTLRQAFNVREGITPEMLQLPRRIREEVLTVGPFAGTKIDFDALRKGFFTAMDWDPETGKPSGERLRELGLDTLAG